MILPWLLKHTLMKAASDVPHPKTGSNLTVIRPGCSGYVLVGRAAYPDVDA